MSRFSRFLIPVAALTLASVAFGQGTANPPFSMRLQQGQTAATITDGTTITMAADAVGTPNSATVGVTYTGTVLNPATSITAIDLSGSTDFSLSSSTTFPAQITPGGAVSLFLTYRPTTSNRNTARIVIGYTESNKPGTITLNLVGTAPEFVFSYTPAGGNAVAVGFGGTIMFPETAVNTSSSVTFVATNRGSGSGVVNAIRLTGNYFDLSGAPLPNVSVDAGRDLRFTVNFYPDQIDPVSGTLSVDTSTGKGSFALSGAGFGPSLEYELLQGATWIPIRNGQTLTFPDATLGDKSTITVRVHNAGNYEAKLTAINLAGAGFAVTDAPFLPHTLAADGSTTVTVTFTPTATGKVTGKLQIGKPTFDLAATGVNPALVYEAVQGSTVTAVLPGQAIAFADTNVGDKSAVTLNVRNTSGTDTKLTAISVAGAGYTITDAPFLPYTLAAGGSTSITVTFAPAAAGRATGKLLVGTASFDLAGNGLGSTMTYAYTAGSVTTTIANNGTVVFTPVAVGSTGTVRVSVTNTGTSPASVASVSVALTGATTPVPVFSVNGVPPLPMTLAPGELLAFSVQFAPSVQGTVTATLNIDTKSFTLSGSGNPPPAFPGYKFDGSTGVQDALTQPAVGLLLSAPYPINVTGTLTLAFNSEVGVADPSVQFAIGGKTVNFTIPANTTRAIFSNGAQQIKMQTGTVAGSIQLTPSFVTDGGINLTPANPVSQFLTVAATAPKLLSVQVTGKTSNTFSLLVTGYAANRSVTQVDVQFTPTSGENVSTTKLTIPCEPSFLAWYAGTTSQQYGSLFTITLPFTLQGDLSKVTSLVDTIQSVSVTLTNRVGTSAAMSVSLK